MIGEDLIYTALNVSAITTLIDTGGIFNDLVAPQDFTGKKYINFYLLEGHNPNLGFGQYVYTINCRAVTMNESLTIAKTVSDQLNKQFVTNGYIITELLPTISPADDTDVYNTPVTAILKTRGVL